MRHFVGNYVIKFVLLFLLSFNGIQCSFVYGQVEFPLAFSDSFSINKVLLRAQVVMLAGYSDSAAMLYRNILEQSNYIDYQYGQVKGRIGLGNIAANSGDYSSALRLYKQALQNSSRTKTMWVTIYNNMANVYKFKGELKQSMVYYKYALQLAENYASELPLETLYNNIAGVLAQLSQPTRALYYLEKGERLAIENRNYYNLSDIYNNKGMAYAYLDQDELSEKNYRSALKVAERYGYANVLQSAWVNLGIMALNRHKLSLALERLETAGGIKGNINPYYERLRLLALGKAYIDLGNYKKAEQNLSKALSVAEQLNSILDLIVIHQVMAELYAKKGDYKCAFLHRSEEKKLNDSVNLKDMTDNIARMEIKYRTANKDKELVRRQFKINQQGSSIYIRNIWIGVAVGGLLLLGVFFVFLRKNYKSKQRLKEAEFDNLSKQQELNEIKAKANGEEMERTRIARDLHDGIMVQFAAVKMNLSALMGTPGSGIEKNNLRPVIMQLDKATSELRSTAHHLMPDMLLQEGLPEAVYYFCNNLQQNVPFKIVFHQLGTMIRMDIQFELVVYRIVQELLQNVIKHAYATEVIVQLSYNLGLLSITVEDNGIGLLLSGSDQEGWGLKSIRSRVAYFKGSLEIESREGIGTSVRIEFDD